MGSTSGRNFPINMLIMTTGFKRWIFKGLVMCLLFADDLTKLMHSWPNTFYRKYSWLCMLHHHNFVVKISLLVLLQTMQDYIASPYIIINNISIFYEYIMFVLIISIEDTEDILRTFKECS